MSEVLIDVVSGSFVLTGDTGLIFRKRRAKSNFKSIGAEFLGDGSIVVPFAPEDGSGGIPGLEEQFQRIERLLQKFSIGAAQSESTEAGPDPSALDPGAVRADSAATRRRKQ